MNGINYFSHLSGDERHSDKKVTQVRVNSPEEFSEAIRNSLMWFVPCERWWFPIDIEIVEKKSKN